MVNHQLSPSHSEEEEEEIQIHSSSVTLNNSIVAAVVSTTNTSQQQQYNETINETISKHKMKQYESEFVDHPNSNVYSGCLYQLFAPFFMLFGSGGIFSSNPSNHSKSSHHHHDKPPTREETSSLLLGQEDAAEEDLDEELYRNHEDGNEEEDLDSYLNRSLEGATSVLHREEQQLYSKFKDSSYRNVFESKNGISGNSGGQQQQNQSHLIQNRDMNDHATSVKHQQQQLQQQHNEDDLLNFDSIPKNELLTMNRPHPPVDPLMHNSNHGITQNGTNSSEQEQNHHLDSISLDEKKSGAKDTINTKATTTSVSINTTSSQQLPTFNRVSSPSIHNPSQQPSTTTVKASQASMNLGTQNSTTTQPPQQHYTPPVIDEETFSNLLQQHYEDDDEDD
ncbi:hypothetical protein C9374_009548 [Naegleria lovaniensis]|uniref:Uncharacterized protein n=1 Tax=Naegleria lovaniensis TaxID=51637 RepID=A0AA88H315_NAELO|nr:uncharacterized protein C9374_009548 [Naegleria lovaniensis]KAG2392971.1 hypothetical protein C9374_009548 [Naegleria lovaniensis]